MQAQTRSTPRFRALPIAAFLCVATALATTAAWGAEEQKSAGASEALFIAQILLLLVVGRSFGELLERLGQPAVMGQLIGGVLLGPSLFGWLWPEAQHFIFPADAAQKSMTVAMADLGILMLLLLTGMETDLRLVRRVSAACFSISATGIVLPFACGFGLAQLLPDSLLPRPDQRLVAGLFLGTALSISSVKIVAIVVREMNFMRRDLGQVIVASAIIEDTIGWVVIAMTFGIATSGTLNPMSLLATVGGTILFMVLSLTVGRRIVFVLIRWANDTLRSEYAVITVILIIMGAMALITNFIGVHTVLGAFVAGILVGESPILSDRIESQLRGIITALFMPVFFGMAGLEADLTVLADPTLALLTFGLIIVASVGKFSGAFAGSRLANLSWKEAFAVGSAMNARGSTEVIVATIGLSMNILSHNLFTMIVTMAVATTLMMPPMLRWALSRIPLHPGEKERLERETLDERGFVARLKRLLLVADDSAIGRFTAQLAGLLGGARGMPTTLLPLAARSDPQSAADSHLEALKRGARVSASAAMEGENLSVDHMQFTTRTDRQATAESVAEEARKGYDLMLVGIDRALTPKGAYSKKLDELTSGFDGPLCLVFKGKSKGARVPVLDQGSTILVPVNGTEVSRRAADVALTMARATGANVRALYVQLTGQGSGSGTSLSHRHEEATLKDVSDMAERYGVAVKTDLRTRRAAAETICKEAARGTAVVVMGVTQRSGKDLLLGETAAGVVARCEAPVVLVAAERARRGDTEAEAQRTGKADARDPRAEPSPKEYKPD
ncbi:cation:proton antiporter domain-containing protein [Ollibium composti]|uniref:Potassium transporter n=1 Tax=Ollibium composti TaxID=2675109 RepID=A0ABY2Q6N3_9HYPH|nr:potassium transporter [Mesorhizobium composti]